MNFKPGMNILTSSCYTRCKSRAPPISGVGGASGRRGVSSGGLRGLEHPPKVWPNSQLSSCVTTIVTEKQQLIAKTNNKLTGVALNGSFSLLLGLKQPSLSSSCLRERVNEGRGQRFGGVAKIFARALRARLAQHLPSSNPGHAPGPRRSRSKIAVLCLTLAAHRSGQEACCSF